MNRPWMPLWVADYLADTGHLGALQSGAYMHLIMHYWQTGSLPDDDGALARIARMTGAEWRRNRAVIQAFFYDGWRHKRVEEEIAKAEAKHARRQAAGKRGGIAKAEAKQNPSNAGSNALASSSQSDSVATATGAKAPPDDPKTAYFRRAREVLGKGSGSLIAKLLRSQGAEDDPRTIAKARAHIETASTKADPSEWLGRVLRPRNGSAPLTDAGNLWPEGIV